MAALTVTLAQNLRKEIYNDDNLEELTMREHPQLVNLKKDADADCDGRYFFIPVMHNNVQNGSHTAATAWNNTTPTEQVAFKVPVTSFYQPIKVAGQLVRTTDKTAKGNNFANVWSSQIESAVRSCGVRMGHEAYGNVGGSLGKIDPTSNPATPTIKLLNIEDAIFFAKGQIIESSANDGTAGGVAKAGSVVLAAVDYSAGTLTAVGNWTTGIPTVATNDFLFVQGDFGLSAPGLASWDPAVAPTAGDNFFGVDRSVSPTLLGGLRYNGTADSYDSVFINAFAYAQRMSFNLMNSVLYINPTNNAALQVAKEGQRFIDSDNDYGIGITGYHYQGCTFIVDPDAPVGVAYAYQADAFEMKLNGGTGPRIDDADGLVLRVDSQNDIYYQSVLADYTFASQVPGKIMRIALPL